MNKILTDRQLIKNCLVLFAMFLMNWNSFGQNVNVHGIVKTNKGMPMPGVNVIVEGTNNGTQTDFDGHYEIRIKKNDAVLVFSYLGFETQKVKVNQRKTIDITLSEDAEALDQVVVIGYGTVKKSDLTGSVSSITDDEFNKGVNTSVDQMIAGKAAGVTISQNSSEPGGGVSVRIRGSSSISAGNSPLYVIDGLPIDNSPTITGTGAGVSNNNVQRNPLNSLNPNDIESIEILKDASATAIYGSRGANGVIIITTKKGKTGKGRIQYNVQTGFQNVANYVEVLNAKEFATIVNDQNVAQGNDPLFDLDNLGPGTDWLREITRTGTTESHNLSFNGGSESMHYNVSLNYFTQEGMIVSSGIDRYIGRINLEKEYSDKFRMGINLNTSLVNDDYVSYGNQAAVGIIGTAIQMDPTLPVYDENGNLFQTNEVDFNNPLIIANIYSQAKTNRTFGNFYAEYNILPELYLKANFGSDRTNARRDSYNSTETKGGAANGGIAGIITGEKENYLFEGTLNYNKSFKNQSLSAVAGYTFQKFINRGFSGSISGFPSDVTLSNNLGLGDTEQDEVNSYKNSNTLISYLGRANYSAFNKYLFTASLRIDGSSRFGKNNKFAYFPSFALAWKASEEKFLNQNKTINNLKLRGSWGRTGNQEIGNYNSLSLLSGGGQAIFNGLQVQGINPVSIPNPDLKWETTTQLDLGIDIGLFKNRIAASADYFIKKTDDLLLYLPVPETSGFSSFLTNIGSVENRGFELSLTSHNIVSKDFTWSTNLNFSTIKNKVLSLGPLDDIVTGNLPFTQGISIIREGEPLNSYYGNIVDGIFQEGDDIEHSAQPNAQPGYPKFRDVNGDGKINNEDRTILGSPFPDYTFGLSNTFNYKNFQLDIFFNGEIGAEILSQNLLESLYPIEVRRNRLREPLINRWTPENPSTKWPSGVNPSAYGGNSVNSLTIQDASFVRLKNIRLSYDLSKKLNFLDTALIYIGAENLITFTDYIGFDPEVNSFGNSNIKADYNSYPTARTFLVGLNIGI